MSGLLSGLGLIQLATSWRSWGEGTEKREGEGRKEAEGKGGGGRHRVGEVSQEWMATAVYIHVTVLWLVKEVSSYLF